MPVPDLHMKAADQALFSYELPNLAGPMTIHLYGGLFSSLQYWNRSSLKKLLIDLCPGQRQ